MRILLLPIALLISGQAYAQSRSSEQPEQLAEKLSNPAVQDGVAGLVGAFADAILDTHVGPLATFSDPRDDIRPEDTLHDLVRRDDPDFDRRLRRDTRRSVATTGRAVRDGVAVSNELDATVRRVRTLIDVTAAALDADTDDR